MENPKLTADFVIRMAMVVRAKEEAGESIDTISADMLDALRRVAYGQLSAKIYVLSLGWAHWSRSVSAISRLVLPDQERIAENGYLDICLLYTSDAADDLLCVDLGGRRII